MKFKVPATQRHHRERAARSRWFAVSQVRFLYGLPTYAVALHIIFNLEIVIPCYCQM